MVDEQPQIEFGALQLRRGQGLQAFAQRRPRDRDRVDAVGLPAPARAGDASRPSASSSRAGPARRVRSETARRSPRHAGSPPAPTPARRPARAPRRPARRSPWRRPGPSARPSARRSPPRPRRSCASACGCPHRARSLTSSTSTSIEWTSGGHGLLGALPRSYQVTPEHPRPATSDTAKGGQAQRPTACIESQLAAGRGAFTSHRTSPTTRIETASLLGAVSATWTGVSQCASCGSRHVPCRGWETAWSTRDCCPRP